MTTLAEKTAKFALIFILIGIPFIIFGYQNGYQTNNTDMEVINVIAAAPEAGGFYPEIIRIPAGETVMLRFSVPDVVHGIAIGPGLGIDIGNIYPGEVESIKIKIDEPGRYTIYCNTWCSPNHWRMRSTIEVFDPADPEALIIPDEVDSVIDNITELGFDIDAEHLIPEILDLEFSSINRYKILSKIS